MAKTKWIEASPDEQAADVAVRSLRSRFAPLHYSLTMAANRSDEDIEYVHLVRTWSRRARAATRVFEDFLPRRRAKWVNRQLRAIRRASNDARDDDVFAARLAAEPHHPGAVRLLAQVRAHRITVQPPIVELHRRLTDRQRLEKRVDKLLQRVRWRCPGDGCDPPRFGPWAAQRLRRTVDEFFATAAGDLTSPDGLHQLRICGKRLRYTMELFGGAFPDGLRAEVYPLTVNLQEKLGEVNDWATAQRQLQHWIELSRDAEDLAYLQTRLAEAQTRWVLCRDAFFAWWTADRQQQLRERFEHLLDARPPQATCA